ncbi:MULTISPECIES: hypothetical protein [Sphingobium]|uniref:Uncharacterized protein n=1 Tax=Sphingobium yanoikuyae ATCC 51230 TaxID=883163 RepID=K9DCK5_SPHYA|nr:MULTISPECIES: hypothetical protein [Sphingobium]EKU75265.1 hypothetical protein HMPREF9718_02793 [Sphingobium yanoikuyae ATCC 51230]WQE07144.1 hypothetical protein U0025_23230 [Sphingobium yanoikuyae]SHL66203.1 hypothetical protein SAMN05518668_102291 [Sphingobium sp. YR657]
MTRDAPWGHRPIALLVPLACLAWALIVTGAQLDREARARPALAAFVPPPFRFFAQAAIVEQGLARGTDPALLYPQARRLLLRRPIASENLTLFGLSALRAGDRQHALQAFSLAASRGWHDDIPQYMALVDAARGGRWDDAALRLRALLQTQASEPTIRQAIMPFMASPPGRAALARLLADNPDFQYPLLSIARTTLAPPQFRTLLQHLASHRARIDCRALNRLVSRWLDQGIATAARDTWDGLCASADTASHADRGFSDTATPFAWQLQPRDDLPLHVDPHDASLSYRNPDSGPHSIAVRRLLLPPGAHRFRMSGRPADDQTFPTLRLRCSGGGPPLSLHALSGMGAEQSATIPDHCPVQKLELIAPKGSVTGLRLTIDGG